MMGCFSLCPIPRAGKSKSPTHAKSVFPASDSEDDRITPTTEMYLLRGGKALASTLESLSGVIPVPFLADFVKVAISVLEACEDAIAVEEDVKDLQKRVYSLTVAIIDTVPAGGSASKDLQHRINSLQSILEQTLEDLSEIKQQKKWILIFFRDLNKERLDKCFSRVDEALEQFHVSHELRVEELLNRIKTNYSEVSAELTKVKQAVENTNKPHNALQTLPIQDMPPPHRIFHGRQGDVDEIVSLLADERTSRVCITGPGGMGKTSVALAVVDSATIRQIFRDYLFWVPCVEAKSADLLRRILYTQLRVSTDSYDSLDALIRELDASKNRRLLLLDNFETPWLSGHEQAKVGDIVCRLARLPHIAVLITMTSAFPPSDDIEWQHRDLQSLDLAAGRDAFQSMYPGTAAGPKLDELLKAVDLIPLAITLLAADGKHSHASPEYLLEQWGRSGTDMLSHGLSQSMDRTIGLSIDREIVKSNPEALTLLAILSMLPAGTTGENLRWWAPTVTSLPTAIATLRTAALIEQGDGDFATSRIFVRPTVKSYMSRQGRTSDDIQHQVHDACYRFVLHHKSIPDDAKFKHDLVALGSEETNIHTLLMQIDVQTLRPDALDALLAFSLYQDRTKPSTAVALYALTVARAAGDERCVAEAHYCLGELLRSLCRYEEAYTHLQEARRGFKGLPDKSNRLRAGQCSAVMSDVLGFCSGLGGEDEVRALVLDAQADLSHDESDKYYVAHGLLARGDYLWWSRDRDDHECLEPLHAAQAIFEELECRASTAECLYLIARTYTASDMHAEALAIAKEASTAAEDSGYLHLICRTTLVVAKCLIVLSLYDEAFEILERSLSHNPVVVSLGVAEHLESIGYICAAKLNLPAARVAYEGAWVQYADRGSETEAGKLGGARCLDNLKKLEGGMDFDDLSMPLLY